MAIVTCNECKFALFLDVGYSNYTVEGTEFYCMANVHPNDGFDRFYGEDDRLKLECDSYKTGDPIHMDVDRENISSLDDKEKILWDSYING